MADAAYSFAGYETERVLREGPLVATLTAVQVRSGLPVVIRALRRGIASGSPLAAGLKAEAEALRKLRHRRIVALYDYVDGEEGAYLVAERVLGASLADVIAARSGELRNRRVLGVALGICEALHETHRKKLVHGNLSPSDVLISFEGELKLTGFGRSGAGGSGGSEQVQPVGARQSAASAYRAPEQILGEAASVRSDIFALGVMLFELVAGERPFQGEDLRSLTQAIRHRGPADLQRRAPHVPAELVQVIERCLEKKPSHRFASVAELARELELLIRGRSGFSASANRAKLLVDVGLSSGTSGVLSPQAQGPVQVPLPRRGIGAAVGGYLALLAAMIASVAVIQRQAPALVPRAELHDSPPPLSPPKKAMIRIVARPWASVSLDGHPVDVTPMAKPVPVAEGAHRFSFTHPKAPTEERIVEVRDGQNLVLEVEMRLPPKKQPVEAAPSASAPVDDSP